MDADDYLHPPLLARRPRLPWWPAPDDSAWHRTVSVRDPSSLVSCELYPPSSSREADASASSNVAAAPPSIYSLSGSSAPLSSRGPVSRLLLPSSASPWPFLLFPTVCCSTGSPGSSSRVGGWLGHGHGRAARRARCRAAAPWWPAAAGQRFLGPARLLKRERHFFSFFDRCVSALVCVLILGRRWIQFDGFVLYSICTHLCSGLGRGGRETDWDSSGADTRYLAEKQKTAEEKQAEIKNNPEILALYN